MGIEQNLEKASCYTLNLAELFQELSDSTVVSDDKLTINFTSTVELLNLLIAKIVEVMKECEAKDVVVLVEKNTVNQLLILVLTSAGLKFPYEYI